MREYQWHEPPPANPPLLSNRGTLHTSKHPTAKHTSNREESSHTDRVCGNCQQKEQNGLQREKSTENVRAAPLEDHTNTEVRHKKKLSPKKPIIPLVQSPKQRQFIQTLLSTKQSGGREQETKSKKAQKMKIRQFVTEYQREYGMKRIKKAKKAESSKGVF